MKAKSMKLRFLVTLHTLFKYSDAEHRMNSVKLNKYLHPFGLECTSRTLSDSVSVLKEFGYDVRKKGEWDSQGVWIENRPLKEAELQKLIFAVSTNPLLSQEQAEEILCSLVDVVNVYQEPLLRCRVETGQTHLLSNKVFKTYTIIQKAIDEQRRLTYTIKSFKYNRENNSVEEHLQWKTLFTPKCVYQERKNLYMVGYNHSDKKVQATNLEDIIDIQLSFKHINPDKNRTCAILKEIEPRDYIPKQKNRIIYEGPVQIRCRGQYLKRLIQMFEKRCVFTEKDARGRVRCTVAHTIIDEYTLFDLASIDGYGIRLEGPEGLVEAVKSYYNETANKLCDRYFKQEKTR